MSNLSMCRICLVENVRMYAVINKNLHELYEKLTGVPFVTQDTRPIVACSFCCAKLKKCFRFMKKCLEAEDLFNQMMNEDYQLSPSTNHDPLEFCSGFIKCAVAHISIVGGCQPEIIAVKEELPDVCETQDDIIEPKEEYLSDDLEAENQDNTSLGIEEMLPHISDSDSESDVPLTKIKSEVENRRAEKTNRSIFGTTITGTSVTTKAKLETRRLKQEGTITVEIEKIEESNLKFMETTHNRTSRNDNYNKNPDQRSLYQVEDFRQDTSKGIFNQQNFGNNKNLTGNIGIDAGEKHFKCEVCQHSFISNNDLETHIQEHTGEKYRCDVCKLSYSQRNTLIKHINDTHTSKKPYKCYECRSSFKKSDDLKLHIRKHIFGDTYFEIPGRKQINKISKTRKCDLCGQTFAERSELREHIKTHGAKTIQMSCMSTRF